MANKKQKTYEERAREFLNRNAKLQKELGLNMVLAMHIPNRSTVPFLAKVASFILEKYHSKMEIRLEDITKKK